MEFSLNSLEKLFESLPEKTPEKPDLTDYFRQVIKALSLITLYNTHIWTNKNILTKKEVKECLAENCLGIHTIRRLSGILKTEEQWAVKNKIVDVTLVMKAIKWLGKYFILTFNNDPDEQHPLKAMD